MKDENTGEALIISNVTHGDANKLRSALMKTVKRVWVLIKTTKKPEQFNVFIANEWGGKPTVVQLEQATDIKNNMFDDHEAETVRDEDVIDVTDDVQFTL